MFSLLSSTPSHTTFEAIMTHHSKGMENCNNSISCLELRLSFCSRIHTHFLCVTLMIMRNAYALQKISTVLRSGCKDLLHVFWAFSTERSHNVGFRISRKQYIHSNDVFTVETTHIFSFSSDIFAKHIFNNVISAKRCRVLPSAPSRMRESLIDDGFHLLLEDA